MILSRREVVILQALRRSAEPLSGRTIAGIAGVAPNTANRALKKLQVQKLVVSMKDGRAVLWSSAPDVAGLAEFEESTQQRVALVVTAVELEHAEVRKCLVNSRRTREGGIPMVYGEVPGDHIVWSVYLARAGMGNATSAALVGVAAGKLKADLVAFVGTAAGLKPADQRHLDVVVASRIHNPHSGRQVSSESGSILLGRDRSYPVPEPLLAGVHACIADSEWTTAPGSEQYDPGHPHAFIAPIVSVDAVQTDPNGPLAETIRTRFQDAAALDMESFGFAAGAAIHDLPFLAVRGISDFMGDKSEPGNDAQQPRAAGNGARLLRDILASVHPDDLTRGYSLARSDPGSDRDDLAEVGPPGGVEVWLNRLERRSPRRAAAARILLSTLRHPPTSIATRLNQVLHRPPAWLREDDTGDGWALIASLALSAGSKIAWQALEKAAHAATLTGDTDASAYFTVTARLEKISQDQADGAGGTANEINSSVLDEFEDEVVRRLGPVIDVYKAVLDKDLATAKAKAEIAVAALGLVDPHGVLRSPAEPVSDMEFDPDLRDLLVVAMLRQLAILMLIPGAADELGVPSGLGARALRGNPVTRDMADDGMRLARWAVELRPRSEGARLTLAQTTLAVLISTSGRAASDIQDEISRRARDVEAEAMSVRDALREWGGVTGEALAVAARARSMQGDFTGALRLLRPAPDGIASQAESRHQEVVRLAAFIARANGNDELALELAEQNPNRVEGELTRAAVLDALPHMASEAKAALFSALELSGGDHHDDFRALMALSRRFNSLEDTEKATVTEHIARVGTRDPDLAEVMRARAFISQGEHEEALRCVRGLERSELVLETHADALVAANRAMDAARLVFDEGRSRGDIPLATAALELAADNGLVDLAHEFALELLAHDYGRPVRLKALSALRQVAHSRGLWSEAESRTRQIIRELKAGDLSVPERVYWQLAEALFFQEKFEKALTVLLEAPAISFDERPKAQLFLSILRRAIDEERILTDSGSGSTVAGLANPAVYRMFMRAATDWAHDEQIAAAAMSVAFTAPGSSFTEAQIADVRDYAEKYFENHGENASVTRIDVKDDNIAPLIELLQARERRQRALEEFAGEVRAGRFPLAALAELAGRTTTEALIRCDLGYILAVEKDAGLGETAARAALDGRVVVDTTALVIAPWTGRPFKKLAANFDGVTVPARLREDVARARSSLAMRSTATVGWDIRAQKPTVITISTDDARQRAEDAERVWTDVQGLQVSADAIPGRERWPDAIKLAQELGVAVWADDIAIRRMARAVGVPAFGSLDLMRVVGSDTEIAAAVEGLRAKRVVDLIDDQPWPLLAEQAGWRTDSPFALAISRPAAWQNEEAFAQFRSLILRRPPHVDPETITDWAHVAAIGLAMAIVPSARHRVVSAMLAWTILAADPFFSAVRGDQAVDDAHMPEDAGRITEHILTAAEAVRDRYYPDADAIALLVDILCTGLLDSVGPEVTSLIVVALVRRLDSNLGRRVFAAYIQSAAT